MGLDNGSSELLSSVLFKKFKTDSKHVLPHAVIHKRIHYWYHNTLQYTICQYLQQCNNQKRKFKYLDTWKFHCLKAKHLTTFWFAFLMIWCPSRTTGEPNSDQQGRIAWLIGSDRNLGSKQPHTKDNYKKVTRALKI